MPPIRLSKRERNLVMIGLGAAIFYVFYQFLLTPQWTEIDKLRTEAKKLRLDLKVTESKVKILEAAEKSFKVEKVQEKKPVIEVKEKALEVLRSIAQTTTRSKLKLLSIKPILGKLDILKFELVCSGSYQQLYDFLDIMHNQNILVLVDSLNITGGGVKDPKLNIKLLLSAHF